jgi:hypothetical protein
VCVHDDDAWTSASAFVADTVTDLCRRRRSCTIRSHRLPVPAPL